MATLKEKLKIIRSKFKKVPSSILDYGQFLDNQGFGDFNKELRKEFNKERVIVGYSAKDFFKGGWSKLEVKYLNKAAEDVINSNFLIKGSTRKLPGKRLFITKKLKGARDVFSSGTPIYTAIAARAAELITADEKEARIKLKKILTDTEINTLSREWDRIGGRHTIERTDAYNLAYHRLKRVGEGAKGGKIGFHLGHIKGHEHFRLAASTRAAIEIYLVGQDKVNDEFLQEIRGTLKVDVSTFNDIIKFVSGKTKQDAPYKKTITQKVVMELGYKNIAKAQEREFSSKIGKFLEKSFTNWTQQIDLQDIAADLELTPTLMQHIENAILSLTTKGKVNSKIKPKNKLKFKPVKFKITNPFNKAKALGFKRSKKYLNATKDIVKEDKLQDIDAFRLKNLINEILALEVEKRMGDATDPAVKLRYQTGRFADSAKLLTLTRAQAGILAGTYTYQRSPYDVFLPGHRLGNATRDPRIYVEGAIREAAMSILKRRFPGIVLELK